LRTARLLLLAAGVACGGSEPSAEEAVLARVEDENRYVVALSGPGRLEPGAQAELRLAVEPRGPFKLAVEFPLRLEVEGDAGLGIARERQAAADAARYDARGGEFEIGVTAREAGTRHARATLRFGICEAELCEPVTRELEFNLLVE
jgi:hypothetical protein